MVIAVVDVAFAGGLSAPAATERAAGGVEVVKIWDTTRCKEAEMSYYILGYSFMMKEDWRVKNRCNITSLSVAQVSGILALLGERAFNPAVAACINETRSFRMIPVKVSGARRGWYAPRLRVAQEGGSAQELDLAATSLGAIEDESAEMYAVMYWMTRSHFEMVDDKEASSIYRKHWLDLSRVTTLNPEDEIVPCAKIRWFPVQPGSVKVATPQTPISQAVVDLFVGGALETGAKYGLGDGFARDVVSTTFGWSPFWVNDRKVLYDPWGSDARAIVSALVDVAGNNSAARLLATSEISPSLSMSPLQTAEHELSSEALRPLTLDAMRAIVFRGQEQVAGDELLLRASTEEEEEDVEAREVRTVMSFGLTSVCVTSLAAAVCACVQARCHDDDSAWNPYA